PTGTDRESRDKTPLDGLSSGPQRDTSIVSRRKCGPRSSGWSPRRWNVATRSPPNDLVPAVARQQLIDGTQLALYVAFQVAEFADVRAVDCPRGQRGDGFLDVRDGLRKLGGRWLLGGHTSFS